MPAIFDKMDLKHQREILVVNAPASFESALAALQGVTVLRDPSVARAVQFSLAFTTRQAEVDALAGVLAAKADGDAMLWFAYPKASSKVYRCEFNRDSGWQPLRDEGFDTVRIVALDEDWSALRFRRVEYIRKPS